MNRQWANADGLPPENDEQQENAESSSIESCTIVTTTANELCAPFHERMPVILDPHDCDLWLDPSVAESSHLLPLLAPFPASQMQTRPVNPRVNNVKNDDPAVLVAEQELF